ncbi:MAG TPA: CHAP domain-containing protein [Rhizomicrobium sp.]|jgi:hypothetical protein
MVRALKFAAAAILLVGMTACASVPENNYASRAPALAGGEIQAPSLPLQCVVYARDRSGIDIHGDAWTWWDQAQGRYARQSLPELGSVLVLTGYGGEKRAHLAVVRDVVSPRLIHVDHANWLNDGRIYLDDPVADVSPANDWSQVRVYNLRDHGWGLRTYEVQGFIAAHGEPAQQILASGQ